MLNFAVIFTLVSSAAIVSSAPQIQTTSPSVTPICSQPRTSSIPSAADLVNLVKPQIPSACRSLETDSGSIASELTEGYVLYGGPAAVNATECEQAFSSILFQCVEQQNFYGGEVVLPGIQLYNLTNARGSLNPILSGSGAVQASSIVIVTTPAAPQISGLTVVSFPTGSPSSGQSSNTLSNVVIQDNTSQTGQLSQSLSISGSSSIPTAFAPASSLTQSSSGTQSIGASIYSQASSSSLTPTSNTAGYSLFSSIQSSDSLSAGITPPLSPSSFPSMTAPPTIIPSTSLGNSETRQASITSKLSTTLPPVAAASATVQAKSATAAVAAYSQNPTKQNAESAKNQIDSAIAAATILAAGTTGSIALAFGGLVSALETAQTAAAAAVLAPGAATASTLAADMAAVENALNEEEKAEEEEQSLSSENPSQTNTKSHITSSSAPSTTSSSFTSSSSASCSASGTGSICISALVPVYSLDVDSFGNVQDVLNAALISSRLAPIMTKGASIRSSQSLSATKSGSTTSATSSVASPSMSSANTFGATSTPTLNCQQNIPPDGPEPSQVAKALQAANGIVSVCAGKFDGSGDSTHMTFNHGSIAIELIRSSATQTLTHCNDAIDAIIRTCIMGNADYGGIYSQDGETYNITNTIAPANPLIPGTDPGAPSPSSSLPATTFSSQPPTSPTTTASPGPPTPSQISSNNHGSALCPSLAGACKYAYNGYNDTWLYTGYTSYIGNPGDTDAVNFIFSAYAHDGCAAIFACDNANAYAVGMLGSQIKNA